MRLELTNVTVELGTQRLRVLDDLCLDVGEGERVALLGPSGVGKSTLLRLIVGAPAVAPRTGAVRVDGVDPFGPEREANVVRRQTGFVRQRDDLVLGLSGRTNALMATTPGWKAGDWLSVLRGRAPRDLEAALTDLARHYGIESRLNARVEDLSGGQRQRVALVRALLPRPRLLLADEPTSGLDPGNTDVVMSALLRPGGPTLVLATHDLAVARRLPRIVALRDGHIVHDGSPPDDESLARIYDLEAEVG
ncbi:ATP-binding cassette domain-containing protein [Actinomadura sp. KC216]|uniref:ATP-binding cassette domain-containing protein n=1 Tax=Actinomadura sp. KC216 TaxID=2530370 RepID=UPI001405103D|nr:ATP-binding cassette domain-containing protein [Actinomadura sp. KC216]